MPKKHFILNRYHRKHFSLSEDTLKNMLLCVVGIACACLLANMTKNTLFKSASDILKQITGSLSGKEVSNSEVMLYSFTSNCKYTLLLFFFSFTNVWTLYSRCFVFYIGFLQGILLSCCLFMKGFSGIFFYTALLIPHIFLLAPVYLFVLHQLEKWHNNSMHPDNNSSPEGECIFPQKKRQIFLQILPLFFLTLVFLLLGAFLEGYLNVPLLRIYH